MVSILFFKGKNPFNFNSQDEELLFTNQFLKKYLLQKQTDLVQKCPECEAYSIAQKSKKVLIE